MINRKPLMATAIIAAVASSACSDTTAPDQVVPGGVSSKSSRRALHVTKECSEYLGGAGQFCTITSSNLKQIKVGSRVIYASPAVGASLDTDIVLDPPGRGKTRAFGHCTLSLATGVGECRLSGGTGKFKKLEARVDVSYLGGDDFAWHGTYSFGRDDDD